MAEVNGEEKNPLKKERKVFLPTNPKGKKHFVGSTDAFSVFFCDEFDCASSTPRRGAGCSP